MKRGNLLVRSDTGERLPEAVLRLSNLSDRWLRQVRGTESKYYRAIGSAESLMARAAEATSRSSSLRYLTRPRKRPMQTTSGRYSVSASDGLREVFSLCMTCVTCSCGDQACGILPQSRFLSCERRGCEDQFSAADSETESSFGDWRATAADSG